MTTASTFGLRSRRYPRWSDGCSSRWPTCGNPPRRERSLPAQGWTSGPCPSCSVASGNAARLLRGRNARSNSTPSRSVSFCIYYKLRREQNEAGVIRHLIGYMAVFYRTEEWAARFSDLLIEARTTPAIREGLVRAVAERPELASIFQTEHHGILKEVRHLAESVQDQQAERTLVRIAAAFEAQEYDDAAAEIGRALGLGGTVRSAVPDTQHAFVLLIASIVQASSGDIRAMMGSLREFVDRFSTTDKPVLQKYVGIALIGIARCEIHEGMLSESIETCQRTINLYGDDQAQESWFVASALNTLGHAFEQLGDREAAQTAYQNVLRRFEVAMLPEYVRNLPQHWPAWDCCNQHLGAQSKDGHTWKRWFADLGRRSTKNS